MRTTLKSTTTDVLEQAELDATWDTGAVAVTLRLRGRLTPGVADEPVAVARHVEALLRGEATSATLSVELVVGPGEDTFTHDD